MLQILKDISDVINSNEQERLISCYSQKTEMCVEVKHISQNTLDTQIS